MSEDVKVTMSAQSYVRLLGLCDAFRKVIEETFTKLNPAEETKVTHRCVVCDYSRDDMDPTVAPGNHWEDCWIADVAVELRDMRPRGGLE